MTRLRPVDSYGLLLILMILLGSTSANGQWEADGTPICVETSSQTNPWIVADGYGGAIIAWDDLRAGNSDIYAQRIDHLGRVLWTPGGIVVSNETGTQGGVYAAPDGQGGILLVWEDRRGGTSDIYAQKLDHLGNRYWQGGGAPVCTLAMNQYDPQIVAIEDGEAMIVWRDYRSGTQYDIYVQVLDKYGNAEFGSGGLAICTALNDKYDPRIVSGGPDGGAIACWEDYRTGTSDIYAQRITASGMIEWGGSDGLAVCTASNNQANPQAVPDADGGVIITWQDNRDGSWDVYAQRVKSSGAIAWTADGVAIKTATGTQSDPSIVSDNQGGAVIAWVDWEGNGLDVYAQKVNAFGDLLWGAPGVAVSDSSGGQYYPWMTTDGQGGAIIAWSDERFGGTADIYAGKVTSSGATPWTENGVAVSTADDTQAGARIAYDGSGGAIIVWQDIRSGFYDIYAQRVERNGYWGYPAPGSISARDVPGDQGGSVNLAWDASRLDPWPCEMIDTYTLWRAIDPTSMMLTMKDGARLLEDVSDFRAEGDGPVILRDLRAGAHYWELVSTVDAYHLEAYASVIPTLFDSTSVCDEYHYFQVIAHTEEPNVFWISEPDSCRSVDNLAPEPPLGLAGEYVSPPSELHLTWDANTEIDLSNYAVYKGPDEGFVPSPANRVGSPVDTFFVDAGFDPADEAYYKVSALDVHENESGFALLRPEEISGAPPTHPMVTGLEKNQPNPFKSETIIRFSLAEPAHVTLAVYDVSGRRVRSLLDADHKRDEHEVRWDGCNDQGVPMAPGIYLYRMEAPGYSKTLKMVITR